jgi:hypothetical protein
MEKKTKAILQVIYAIGGFIMIAFIGNKMAIANAHDALLWIEGMIVLHLFVIWISYKIAFRKKK